MQCWIFYLIITLQLEYLVKLSAILAYQILLTESGNISNMLALKLKTDGLVVVVRIIPLTKCQLI